MKLFITAIIVGATWSSAFGFQQIDPSVSVSKVGTAETESSSPISNRSDFLRTSAAAAAGCLVAGTFTIGNPSPVNALDEKLIGISNEKLKEIVKKDIVENQYLCNGKLTRSIYDESATFTDEIDTYGLDQWMKGTQKLFVGENSEVRLVGDLDVTDAAINFKFDEDLQFRIPPVYPTVSLTGRVELKRDSKTGLITSYQEFWDQDVNTVLKSAKFKFRL